MKKKVVIPSIGPLMKYMDILTGYLKEEYPEAEIVMLERRVTDEELIAAAEGAEVIFGGHKMSEKIYAALPGLRAVPCPSVGFDAADTPAATKHGVVVTNVPDYCLDEVSGHAVTLLLHMQRGLYKLIPYVKDGNWGIAPIMPRQRLEGLTVGIFGFGSIARVTAKKLSGFKLNLLACDPYVSEEVAAQYGAKLASFDEMLEQSDFIIIHAPYLPSTKGVFNEEAFRKMKPTAYIVNVGRGPIIDTEALYKALTEGWIAGAGLDVLENEPPQESDMKIVALPNVVVTPHSAFYSEDAVREQLRKAANEAGRALRGERPRCCANRDVLAKIDWFVD